MGLWKWLVGREQNGKERTCEGLHRVAVSSSEQVLESGVGLKRTLIARLGH